MSRRNDDDTNEKLALATVGFIVWVISAVVAGVIGLISWDRRKRQEQYPEGIPLSPAGKAQQGSYYGSGIVLLVVGLVVMYQGVVASAYSNSSSSAPPIFLIGLMVAGGGAYFFYAAATKRLSKNEVAQLPPPPEVTIARVYSIRLTRDTDWNPGQAQHFLEQCVASQNNLIFTIRMTAQAIAWEIVETQANLDSPLLERLIRSSYPTAELEIRLHEPITPSQSFIRFTSVYALANEFVAPLRYVTTIKTGNNPFDPLVWLTQALNGLNEGEQVCFNVAVRSAAPKSIYESGYRMVTQSTIHPLQWFSTAGIGNALGKMATGQDRTRKYVAEDQRLLELKLRQNLYVAAFYIQFDALTPERIIELAKLADSFIEHFAFVPYNALHYQGAISETTAKGVETAQENQATDAIALANAFFVTRLGEKTILPFIILEARELACLWHLPHTDFTAPRIQWSKVSVDVSEVVARNTKGVWLGMGTQQGKSVPVRLPHADRVTHLNIVGKTGTGKSTLMHHLIHQDIAQGRGVAVIDPHGRLVSDILRTSIPPEREGDVVILDLANEQFPPPLNPLIGTSDYTSTLKMVSIIDRLFAGTEESARMAGYLRAALIPLQTEHQATMRDVTRLFMDAVYRQRLLERVDDPETQDFWDYHYNPSSAALQRQIAEPIIIRVRPFYANPSLYPVLCHPDSLDFRALMQQNKIILLSLAVDEERIPEQERNLIGSLLVSRLQMSGMKERVARSDPYFIYIDEVQKFVTTSLSDVLSEARKFGLSLVTANQYLEQLTGKTLEAVMGNVGTTVIFRCSPDDAQTLATYVRPEFTAHNLVDLDRFVAVVKMQSDGKTQPAFTLQSPEPLVISHEGAAREQYLREKSVAAYTPKSRGDVMTWLRDRYGRGKAGNEASVRPDDPNNFYE